MFGYLTNKRKFIIKLGQYVSHEIVIYFNSNSGKVHRTIEELNNLDRYELAYDFYNNLHSEYLEGAPPRQDICEDIAREIDRKIPAAYYKWNEWKDGAPSTQKISKEWALEKGFAFYFKENQ